MVKFIPIIFCFNVSLLRTIKYHYKSGETEEEKKNLYILVTLRAFLFLLFDQDVPPFHFALGLEKYAALAQGDQLGAL